MEGNNDIVLVAGCDFTKLLTENLSILTGDQRWVADMVEFYGNK
ncbi:hypothetical protein R615_17115 [Thalassolituus oleivorans R6-15]|nr:hypothetical protein R615_17115 [Thalassolituus oleivorans R6-15]